MKKLLALLFVFTFVFGLAACGTEQGDYEPGVYFGYSSGHQNSFAVLTVDENGFIVGLLVDTVYLKVEEGGPVNWVARGNEREGIATTKRSLDGGCGYNMWPAQQVVNCEVEGEIMWHVQVDMLVEVIIEAQEIPTFDFDGNYFDHEEGTDVIAGVSIAVNSYLEAIENALEQARK